MSNKDEQFDRLSVIIEGLAREVSNLRGENKDVPELQTLEEKIVDLKKQISDYKINRDKKREEFDRGARDQNTKSERDQFEKQMVLILDQFDGQVEYLKDRHFHIRRQLQDGAIS